MTLKAARRTDTDESGRRLLVALGVSSVLHLMVLVYLESPDRGHPRSPVTLQVSLKPQPAPEIRAVSPLLFAPDSGGIALLTPETHVQAWEDLVSRPPSAATVEPNPQPVTPEVAGDTAVTSRVDIEFELYRREGRVFAKARQTYQADSLNRYHLSYRSTFVNEETRPWQLEISGIASGSGLAPSSYHLQGSTAGRLLGIEDSVRDEVEDGQSGTLSADNPDPMSLSYLFMRKAAQSGNDISRWENEGRLQGRYYYRIVGHEAVRTDFSNTLDTIHVSIYQVDSQDTIEFWLAPGLRYAPIRILATNASGEVIDQIATRVEIQ